jgi:hypothetical protein
MEKTMILDQFTSRAAAGSPTPEHILGGVKARGRDGKMTQKGVFNMRRKFCNCLK